MKGISTILAMILIVIITVALIGLTYTFASGLLTTTTGGAQNQTTTVTGNIQRTAYVTIATCTYGASKLNVTFTIKATGVGGIIAKDLGVTLDGADMTTTTWESTGFGTVPIGNSAIAAGKSKSYILNTSATGTSATRTLTVSAPAGDVSYTLSPCWT